MKKRKRSERTLQFQRHWLEAFEQKIPVEKAAKEWGISAQWAYKLIHELEEEMGLKYDALLYSPHSEHVVFGRKHLQKVYPIDFSAFQEEFRNTISSMDKTLGLMGETVDNWPEIPSLTPEREEICV